MRVPLTPTTSRTFWQRGRKTQKDIERALTGGLGKNTLDEMRELLGEVDVMSAKAQNEKARGLLICAAKAIMDQETGHAGSSLPARTSS